MHMNGRFPLSDSSLIYSARPDRVIVKLKELALPHMDLISSIFG